MLTLRQQTVTCRGITFTNYRMAYTVDQPSRARPFRASSSQDPPAAQ
ncbi:MAG: hypothetical protein RIK87_14955 [Fuerstiella sp.]